MASMNIPDEVYDWLVDFFAGHSHCTRFHGCTSGQLDISASIMQRSAIDQGPDFQKILGKILSLA